MQADFILEHMVNRPDAYGQYSATGKSFKVDGPVDEALIEKHLAGETTIGLYTTGTDQLCRWAAWDIDNHDGTDLWANFEAAKDLYELIEGAGFLPILEDSDGQGGYHLWVVFDEPVEAWRVHDWARSFPMPEGIEVFPKQRSIENYGNFIRLPGKHHKKDHWSTFWEGDQQWSPSVIWELSDHRLVPETEPPEMTERAPEGAAEGLERMSKMQEADDARLFNRCVAALDRLSPDRANQYEDGWIDVGMILHRYDPSAKGLAVWDNWSRQGAKYEPGVCDKHWKSFDRSKATVKGIGTLMHMVQGDDPREMDLPIEEKIKVARDRLAETLGFPVDRFIKRGTEAGNVTYYIESNGQTVEIGGYSVVENFRKFKIAVAEVLNLVVNQECQSRKKWTRVENDLLTIMEIEEIEEDTRIGEVREILEGYFHGRRRPIEIDDSYGQEEKYEVRSSRKPFIEDGFLHIQVPDLKDYARRMKIDFKDPYKVLRSVGWLQSPVRTENSTVRYWSIPVIDPCIPGFIVSSRKQQSVKPK